MSQSLQSSHTQSVLRLEQNHLMHSHPIIFTVKSKGFTVVIYKYINTTLLYNVYILFYNVPNNK